MTGPLLAGLPRLPTCSVGIVRRCGVALQGVDKPSHLVDLGDVFAVLGLTVTLFLARFGRVGKKPQPRVRGEDWWTKQRRSGSRLIVLRQPEARRCPEQGSGARMGPSTTASICSTPS